MSALVSDGNVTKPSFIISQTIQKHISGARNQATIGLDIRLHHKHGSSDVIKLLNSHSLVSSYYEVLRFFCKSADSYVSKNTDIIISYEVGSSQWNLDQSLAGGQHRCNGLQTQRIEGNTCHGHRVHSASSWYH